MGLLIVSIVIVAFSIFSFIMMKHTNGWIAEEMWFGGGIMSCVIGGMMCLIVGICGICNAIAAPSDYTRLVETKKMIEHRIDNLDSKNNYMVNGGVYEDIIEYNSEIREYKRFGDNFWIGMMYDDDIAALELIEFEGVN